jgi:hypothetical protein
MKKLILIAIISSLISSNAFAISASYRAKLEHSGCTQLTEANGTCDINKSRKENNHNSHVANRLHAVTLTGRDYDESAKKTFPLLVSIGEGFTQATINDEPVKITHQQKDFYELRGNGYIVSVAMDDKGIESASWNHYKGRAHGTLNIFN